MYKKNQRKYTYDTRFDDLEEIEINDWTENDRVEFDFIKDDDEELSK